MNTMTVLGLALALLTVEPDGHPLKLLKVAQDRSDITSGEVVVKAKILVCEAVPEYAGSEWTLHYWFGSDGLHRLDRHWQGLKRDDDRDHRDNASFDGAVYRAIGRKDNAYPVQEYRNKKPFHPHEVFDPRLFGLDSSSIVIFHHASYERLRKRLGGASVERGEEGGLSYERFRLKNGVSLKYVYDRDGLPVQSTASGKGKDDKTPWNREARIEYGSSTSGAGRLPTRIDRKEFTNGKLINNEMLEITWSKINEPFDKALCSWVSMNPVKGSPLSIDDESKRNVFWDGQSFREFAQIPAQTAKVGRATSGVIFWASVNVGILCIASVVYRFVGRLRKQSP